MGRGAEGSEGDQSRAELSRGVKGDPGHTGYYIRERETILYSYILHFMLTAKWNSTLG